MVNRSPGIDTPGATSVLRTGHIGVVTVTYNSGNVLPDFFDSLASQTCREYTLYVVDNASNDETLEQCRTRTDLPIVVLANDENLGVAEGNNQGIRAALADGCEFVLLLNNDTVFGPQLFAELRDGLQKHACAMVTPKIYYHDAPDLIWAAGGHFQRWLGSRPQHYGEGVPDRGQYDKTRVITYAPTCCVLIHRSVFGGIGLMDPLYFVYWDDVDFMYRARRSGYVLRYIPQSSLHHKVSSLAGNEPKPNLVRFAVRNRVYFTKKNLSAVSAQFWIDTYRMYLYVRYLFGKDSRQEWEWKNRAVHEGLAML